MSSNPEFARNKQFGNLFESSRAVDSDLSYAITWRLSNTFTQFAPAEKR